MDALTIGRLADAAGVNIETVRYYERRGLLDEPPRSASGYRQYSTEDLWRLQFIGRGKQLGFTLKEIGELLGESDGRSPADVVGAARAKIDAVDAKVRELADIRTRLASLVDVCETGDPDDCVALRVIS